MVIAEVKAIDPEPVLRDPERLNLDLFIQDREHEAGAERGNAFDPRVPLVLRIAINDRLTLLGRVVLRVLKGHPCDMTCHTRPPQLSMKSCTTSDMPLRGVNVIHTIPSLAFVRVRPSV